MVGAAEAFQQALQQRPGYPAILFALGQVYQALFEQTGLYYVEAVQAYEVVLESLDDDLPSDNPRHLARVFLGQLWVRGGEYRQAVTLLGDFLRLRPDYYAVEEVWNSIGVARYYLNEYHEAVRAFERALEVAPGHPSARFNLRSVFTRLSLYDVAMANRRLGRLDIALEEVDKLLELAPRYLPARLQRALILRDLEQPQAAEAEARRSLSLGSNPQVLFELHELLGDLLAARGETEPALVQYRKCLRIFPGYVQVVEKMNAIAPVEGEAEGEDERRGPSFQADSVQPILRFPM